jgi:hypothetical protein
MISLLHPSRGRPEKSYHNTMEWISKCGVDVEVILSVDSSDDWKEYFSRYPAYPADAKTDYVRMYMHDNKSVVEATNRAAEYATGDILLYLSDDFKCFDNWGVVVENEFKKYSGPTLIKVDDCLQKFTVPVLTIPIMNRELYNQLGYFWHPGYKSMFVDEHLYWRSKKLGALQFAEHIKFEHQHVSVGKADDDETYRRSAANWDQGKVLFAKHRREGFIE